MNYWWYSYKGNNETVEQSKVLKWEYDNAIVCSWILRSISDGIKKEKKKKGYMMFDY